MGNMTGKGLPAPGKKEEKKQIKKPDPSTVTFGKKKKKKKGVELAAKLPTSKYCCFIKKFVQIPNVYYE